MEEHKWKITVTNLPEGWQDRVLRSLLSFRGWVLDVYSVDGVKFVGSGFAAVDDPALAHQAIVEAVHQQYQDATVSTKWRSLAPRPEWDHEFGGEA